MEVSVCEEQEVAEVLINLWRLIRDADRATSGIHNLQWGARRRRSAGSSDRHHPLLHSEHHDKKRCRKSVTAGDFPKPPETSSPETPLDFCPSGEEAKKPRRKQGESLINQLEDLNHLRTQLEKDAAEVKKRLDALKDKNSMLKDLRVKMENQNNQLEQEASTSDLHPQQIFNQQWPQHWLNNHVLVHRAPPQWSWMSSQIWKLDTGKCVPRASVLPDLNSTADKDAGEEVSLRLPSNFNAGAHFLHQHQNPQEEQRRGSLAEQRAARKKRIEMMHMRRRIAAMR